MANPQQDYKDKVAAVEFLLKRQHDIIMEAVKKTPPYWTIKHYKMLIHYAFEDIIWFSYGGGNKKNRELRKQVLLDIETLGLLPVKGGVRRASNKRKAIRSNQESSTGNEQQDTKHTTG